MPPIASLIVRIGAQDQEIQKALASIGEKAKSLDANLKKLGGTALGSNAQKSLDTMRATIDEVTKAQQRLAERATLAARGLEAMGGASRLTDAQLKQVNRTLQDGISAYKALGQEAPAQLKRVADSVGDLNKPLDFFDKKIIAIGSAIGNILGNAATQAVSLFISAGKEAFHYADALENLSVATGIGVGSLQDLEAIGVTSGVSIEALASAVEQLQKHLDDPAAVKAIERMGLDYARIRSLKPEDQFLEIAKSVSSITDQVERQNIGAAVFGKTWNTIAPAIKGNLDELVGSMKHLSDAQVEALDHAGDRFDLFVANNKRRVAGLLSDLLIAADEAQLHWSDIFNPASTLIRLEAGGNRAAIKALEALPKLQDVAPKLRLPEGFAPGADQPEAIRDLEAQIAKAQVAAERFKGVQDQLFGRATIDHVNEVVRALGGTEHLTQLTASATKKLHDEVGQALEAYHSLGRTAPTVLTEIFNKTNILTSKNFSGKGFEPAGLPSQTFDLPTLLASHDFSGVTGAQTKLQQSLKLSTSVFSGIGAAAPQALVAALAGGGNPAAAVAGTIGNNIGANLVTKFGGAITKSLGKTFGGAVNAVLPGLGALAEPLINFLGKLVGKSEESRKVSPLRDAFFNAAGGLDVLNPKVLQLTGNLKGVEDVFKAKTVDDYNAAIQRLNAILGTQGEAMQKLDAAVQKYGFSIDELGPKFAQQKLNQQQGQLLEEWKLLNVAVLDQNNLLTKTQESFQGVVTAALESGATISDELQDPIQRLADMGLLVDENGNKLTDLSRLKFGPLDSEFATLTKAINNLTRALGGAVDEADALAQDRDFEIRGKFVLPGEIPNDGFTVNDATDGASGGAVVRSWGLQHLAVGGFARGTDTVPAMLTPGELVLNAAQQNNLGNALGSGQTVHNTFTGPVLAEESYVEQHLVKPFLRGIRRYAMPEFTSMVRATT